MGKLANKIEQDIKKKQYKKPKRENTLESETENKISAVEYYNSLSDADKISFQEQIQKKKVRNNYISYLKYVYGDNYILTNFHKMLATLCQNVVERLEKGDKVRLAISVPPQHGKSMTLTETLPSWFIGRNPDLRVITTAYNADIAEKFGDKNRQLVKRFGKELFGIEISDSQDNKTLWDIKNHLGGLYATGLGGSLTSNNGALIIVDDPFKNEVEANTQGIRDTVWSNFTSSVLTRQRGSGNAIIVIHTRWNDDDLIGRLRKLEDSEWLIVNIPCVWESGEDRLLHRRIGQTLCPELGFDAKWAESMKKTIGLRQWNALYQGRPYVDGGNIVKRADIKFYDKASVPVVFDEITMSCDLSNGGMKTDNDPNCLTVWGRLGANHYLLKVVMKKCGFTQTIDLIRHLCSEYPQMRRKIIERKANGNATVDMLNQQIGGFIPFDPKGDSKETRFKAVSPYFESGNVYFPNEKIEPNIENYIEQVIRFPNVGHDDFVDTVSQYLLNYSYKCDYGRIQTDNRYANFSKAIRGLKYD